MRPYWCVHPARDQTNDARGHINDARDHINNAHQSKQIMISFIFIFSFFSKKERKKERKHDWRKWHAFRRTGLAPTCAFRRTGLAPTCACWRALQALTGASAVWRSDFRHTCTQHQHQKSVIWQTLSHSKLLMRSVASEETLDAAYSWYAQPQDSVRNSIWSGGLWNYFYMCFPGRKTFA